MGAGKRPELDEQGRKQCGHCKEFKELSAFSPLKGKAFGVNSWCKVCVANKRKSGYTLEKARAYHLLSTYNLTAEEYERMFAEQNGVCACCGQPEKKTRRKNARSERVFLLHVDHCHTTGRVRGLLCNACNTALGLLEENPKRIEALLHYVQERGMKAPLAFEAS